MAENTLNPPNARQLSDTLQLRPNLIHGPVCCQAIFLGNFLASFRARPVSYPAFKPAAREPYRPLPAVEKTFRPPT